MSAGQPFSDWLFSSPSIPDSLGNFSLDWGCTEPRQLARDAGKRASGLPESLVDDPTNHLRRQPQNAIRVKLIRFLELSPCIPICPLGWKTCPQNRVHFAHFPSLAMPSG
jgi:hypothetical protein